ncbi:FkbM family methyltransferase [Thermoproteota archaeon]
MSNNPFSHFTLSLAYKAWKFLVGIWYRVDTKNISPYVVVELNFDGEAVKFFHPAKSSEDLWRSRRLSGREPEVESVFKPKLGWTVLDIGAHIGYYTIMASKKVGSNGQVICVEAYSGNYDLLLKNIKVNSCHNVKALKKAITNYDGSTQLFFGSDSGHNTLLEKSVFATTECEDVDAITLDILFSEQKIEFVDLVKIDIEGNELNLLKGANHVLNEGKIQRIVIEVHTPITRNNPIHIYLQKFGYNVSVIRSRFAGLYPTRHHIYAVKN